MSAFSYSRLNVAQCPFRYAAEYLRKDADRSNGEAANRGKAIHESLATLLRKEMGTCPPGPLSNMNAFDIGVHFCNEFNVTSPYSRGWVQRVVTSFVDPDIMIKRPFKVETILDVEVRLGITENGEPCDYEDPAAFFRGIIDLVAIDGSTAIIVDHKGQNFSITPMDKQFAAYALLILKHYDYITEVKTIVHFCTPKFSYYSRPAIWTRDGLHEFWEILKESIDAALSIKEDAQETNSEAGICQYCSSINQCPAVITALRDAGVAECTGVAPNGAPATGIPLGPIRTAAEAVELAKKLSSLAEWSEKAKKNLKAFAAAHGPIAVGKKIAEVRVYENRDYSDVTSIKEILQKHKVDLEQFWDFSEDKLKSFLNSCPDILLLSEIERVTLTSPTSKFGFFKA